MKNLIAATILFVGLPLSATAQDTTKPLAVVNGTPITEGAVSSQAAQLSAQGQNATQEQILDELVNLEVMRQEATRQKLNEQPQVAAELDTMQARVLANALLSEFAGSVEISEEDLKAEYNQQIAQNAVAEFKASHILLEEEERAKEIIVELDGGADFAEAAKKHSTGPSGTNGGDLGWFAEGAMVPEFSAAVAQMETGKHSATPVKTQFGWHIIKLIDTRSKDPQPYEAVKQQLQSAMVRNKVGEYITSLRNAALIEMPK